MAASVRDHGYGCDCTHCVTYRKYGGYYEARVRREYAWALARATARIAWMRPRDRRALARRNAYALAHVLGCQCEIASKWRQEAVQRAFQAQVDRWEGVDSYEV